VESKSLDEFVKEGLERYPDIRGSRSDAEFFQSLISSFETLNEEMFGGPKKSIFGVDGHKENHDWYQLSRLSFTMVWSGDPQTSSLSTALHQMFRHWRVYLLPAGTLFKDPEVMQGSMLTDVFKNLVNTLNVFSRNWMELISGRPTLGKGMENPVFQPQKLQMVSRPLQSGKLGFDKREANEDRKRSETCARLFFWLIIFKG